MKALNEPIARRANRKDNCTHGRSFRTRSFRLRENHTCCTPCAGKFWESRYKCQALLEDHAVLSCMAYVDLNPARAAMCNTLDKSDHTTIQRRLREREQLTKRRLAGKNLLDRPLAPRCRGRSNNVCPGFLIQDIMRKGLLHTGSRAKN